MTDAEATGSRRERCALAAAFLLSETTHDAAVDDSIGGSFSFGGCIKLYG